MGRRLPVGAGGKLTLRLRLVAAAAGIVAVSLLLGGALTWVMVRDLEFQSVQDQLDRQVMSAAAAVRSQECVLAPQPGTAACRPASPADFTERLNLNAPRLGSGRLLLLDNERVIVSDSGQAGTAGTLLGPTPSKRFAGVFEARTSLGDQTVLAAPIKSPGKPVAPLRAAYVVD